MTDKRNQPDLNPATQRDQPNEGAIAKPQQTDATMREKNLPRGSEPETHARK